jgi:hypothetical protein
MNTIQRNDTPCAVTSNATAPRTIGIHIKLPPLAFWTFDGRETEMLSRLISTALNRRSLLVGKLTLVAFEHQVIGLAKVTSLGIGLSTISGELSSVELITGAHLAWSDASEGIWRTDRPLPEPMPFQHHLDAFTAWHDAFESQTEETRAVQIGKTLCAIGELLGKIAKRQTPPTDNAKA